MGIWRGFMSTNHFPGGSFLKFLAIFSRNPLVESKTRRRLRPKRLQEAPEAVEEWRGSAGREFVGHRFWWHLLKSPGKNTTHISRSDRFPLKPTGEIKHILNQMEDRSTKGNRSHFLKATALPLINQCGFPFQTHPTNPRKHPTCPKC